MMRIFRCHVPIYYKLSPPCLIKGTRRGKLYIWLRFSWFRTSRHGSFSMSPLCICHMTSFFFSKRPLALFFLSFVAPELPRTLCWVHIPRGCPGCRKGFGGRWGGCSMGGLVTWACRSAKLAASTADPLVRRMDGVRPQPQWAAAQTPSADALDNR